MAGTALASSVLRSEFWYVFPAPAATGNLNEVCCCKVLWFPSQHCFLLTKSHLLGSPSGLSFLSFYARWEPPLSGSSAIWLWASILFLWSRAFPTLLQTNVQDHHRRVLLDLSLVTADRFKKNYWELIIITIIKYNVPKYLEFLLRKSQNYSNENSCC